MKKVMFSLAVVLGALSVFAEQGITLNTIVSGNTVAGTPNDVGVPDANVD